MFPNGASQMTQWWRILPGPETCVPSLGQENPLEEGMATQSDILAWETLWTEKPDWLPSRESQEWNMTEWLSTLTREKDQDNAQALERRENSTYL